MFLSFPLSPLFCLCPSNAHTAFSICTPLSSLSISCPLEPQVTRGRGRYHSVRGTLEEERVPFRHKFSLVSSVFLSFFLSLTSAIVDVLNQKTFCQEGSDSVDNSQASYHRLPDALFTVLDKGLGFLLFCQLHMSTNEFSMLTS